MSAKPVSERRSWNRAHTPQQALRALFQCMTGSRYDPSIVSGRSAAHADGFPVLAVMPRVAPRNRGVTTWCSVPLTGCPPKRHHQVGARPGRDAWPPRTRRPGAPCLLRGAIACWTPWDQWVSDCVFEFLFAKKSLLKCFEPVWYSKILCPGQ